MADAGAIAIVACVSPYRADRSAARIAVGDHPFVEVYLATPLSECERRDPKGLYARGRSGAAKNVTGLSDPYEAPESPDVRLDTTARSVDDCARTVMTELRKQQLQHAPVEGGGSGI